ncbi:toxin-antitoxin system YwqK family antitoxin [Maribacter sp. 2210JD10-5]|uniref:toxin-antitoxin system YwqK family antitoxin n=1 Tax=Maribacter sp. 2210JD10-5 TaxID=3386272 RepID=UPI0039BCB999
MYSKSFLILFITLLSFGLFAQNDTIYYDSQWKKTVKDSASFFRPPVQKEGILFRVKDYYISGQIQMSALSKSADKDVWQGQVTWYNEDGSVFQQGDYVDNRREGDFITYLGKKRLVAKFEDGYIVSGQQNMLFGGRNMYTEYVGDTIVTTIYDKNLEGIRHERYGIKDKFEVYSKYYGNDGAYLGKKEVLSDGSIKGVEVFYCYNPMQVQEIRYYENGKLLGSTTYYPNGRLRELFVQKPEYSKTFYTPEGKEFGKITYKMGRDYLKPFDGTEYYFSYSKGGVISSIPDGKRVFENGIIQEEEQRYENQKLKRKTFYENGGKELMISYDENSNEIGRITYNNYAPVDGIEIFDNRTITYKEGKVIEEIDFYRDTDKKFSVKTRTTERYFDKDGTQIAEMKLDTTQSYSKPFEGKRIYKGYEGDISSIEEYKNGFLYERTRYRLRKISDTERKKFKRVERYGKDSFDKIKEIRFYSNGNIQSDIDYVGYKETKGSFYDDKGALLGSYDYNKKEGVLYEFFDDSDELKKMQIFKGGKEVRLKNYDYGPNNTYGQIIPVLVEDIDVSCCASFYNRNGELLASFTYKDGKPWEGTAYDRNSGTKYTIKEGKRNGLYQKLDYDQSVLEEGKFKDDKEEGIFKYYDTRGVLLREQNYIAGVLNGKSVYYDTDGKITSSLVYRQGKPYDGTLVLQEYYGKSRGQETYKEGKLTKKVSFGDNGKSITTYGQNDIANTVAYYKDSEKKRLEYTIDRYKLKGNVIRYDTNGKEQHRAMFADGNLISGTVYLTPYNYSSDITHMVLNKKDETVKVEFINKDGETVFQAKEKLPKNKYDSYINKLNIYLDNLDAGRLY